MSVSVSHKRTKESGDSGSHPDRKSYVTVGNPGLEEVMSTVPSRNWACVPSSLGIRGRAVSDTALHRAERSPA